MVRRAAVLPALKAQGGRRRRRWTLRVKHGGRPAVAAIRVASSRSPDVTAAPQGWCANALELLGTVHQLRDGGSQGLHVRGTL